jgi:branched-chain amino acid transport system substrate-binding protein
MKNVWIGIGIIIVVILVVIGVRNANKSSNNEVLKIGFVGPLTGEASSYGQIAKEGVELAVQEINSKGGIDGRMVEVIYEDGKCSGKDAVSAAQKLIIIDKVQYIIGGMCSGETLGLGPVAESVQVLVISPGSSNSQITDLGDYIFRNHPSDGFAGKAIAGLAINNGNKKIGIISENTDYAQGIRTIFLEEFKNLGGEVLVDESFNTGNADFRSSLLKMKASGVDSIFVNPQTESGAVQIANQARELALDVQFFGAYFNGESARNSDALDGIIMVALPDIAENNNASNFSKNFVSKFNKEPEYPFVAGAAYDIVYILKQAIEKQGDNSTRVKDYLYTMKPFEGTVGNYNFDENGDVLGVGLNTKRLENKEFVPFVQ